MGYTERWIGEPTLAASVHTQCETTQGGLVSTNGVFGQEAALVEFTALRGEILGQQAHQHTLLALQLTIAGAIYSFALSGPGRQPLAAKTRIGHRHVDGSRRPPVRCELRRWI